MFKRTNRVRFLDRAIALVFALVVFAAFAFYLWTNIQSNKPENREVVQAFNAKEIATIAATTVTEDQIKKQKDSILKKEQEKKRKDKLRQDKEKKKLADIKKKQEQEKKKLEEIKKKKIEEEKAIALKKKKAKEAEKKRKSDEEKRKLAEEKRKKKEAEAKKKREAEEHAKREQEEAQAQRKEALQAEIDAERQQALTEQSARASTTVKNRYAALIREKLQSNFIVPIGSRAVKVPVVNIRLDEAGNVLSSRIVTDSGDFSFDQAVLAAVAKSSPLPLPKDNPAVRKELQDINLRANF